MPQTYGPFSDKRVGKACGRHPLSRDACLLARRARAQRRSPTMRRSAAAATVSRARHGNSLLEPKANAATKAGFEQALSEVVAPCIALNVSGLLYFARRSFGLRDNYKELVPQVIQWALSIPQQLPTAGAACRRPDGVSGSEVAEPGMRNRHNRHGRVQRAARRAPNRSGSASRSHCPTSSDPARAKYAMRLCDYFLGARMHAFIGASSQCVPGTLFAYSKKAEGLARLMGIADSVVDLRARYDRLNASKDRPPISNP